jgi:hypothetical protein
MQIYVSRLFSYAKRKWFERKAKNHTWDIVVNKTKMFREWDIGQGWQLEVLFCVLCSVHFRQRPSVQPAKGVQHKTRRVSNKRRVTGHGVWNHEGVNNINVSITRWPMAVLPAFDCLQQFILLIINYFSTKNKPICANESLNLTNNSVMRVTVYCYQQYAEYFWKYTAYCLRASSF